jgi:hypothetical protein
LFKGTYKINSSKFINTAQFIQTKQIDFGYPGGMIYINHKYFSLGVKAIEVILSTIVQKKPLYKQAD